MSASTAVATVKNLYARILSKLPVDNVTFCFGYGSRVLKQINNQNEKNMIDFILAVDDPEKWHANNINLNPGHYSFLSLFGNKAVAKVQTNIPSRVYFNSMISIKDENVVIKYGVISQNDLIADLLDWNDLYVAGRLQKPVKIIRAANSDDLVAALQLNLHSAVHAALLLLPENFSEMQFYKTVTSLSYLGDFRMKFGEDRNKVNNIVLGGLQKFRNLYSPILKVMEDYVEMPPPSGSVVEGERSCRQDVSPSAKHFHLNHLPRTPQRKLVQFWNKGSRNRQDTEDVLRAMAFDQDCGEVVKIKGPEMSSDEESLHQNREKFVVERSLEPQPDNVNPDFFGPVLPPHLLGHQKSESDEQEKQIYGPILPGHLQKRKRDDTITSGPSGAEEKCVIGPEIPEYLKRSRSETEEEESETSDVLDEDFGPSTDLMSTEVDSSYYRAISKQSFIKKEGGEPSVQREEWMTQLPEKKRSGFGLLARQFKTRVQTDRESDSSVWTDTPANQDKKDNKKDHKIILEMNRLKERDKEMEKLAEKAAKKLRKKESLLEIHSKNKKKKKKKEEKEKKLGAPERRPFDRNIDLQIHRFDESKRRAIMNKNQFLNDKFAPGQSKFL